MKTKTKIGIIGFTILLITSCKKEERPNNIQIPSIQVTNPIVKATGFIFKFIIFQNQLVAITQILINY